MESPLKRLACISGSSRAIAVAEAHRAHEERAKMELEAIQRGHEFEMVQPRAPKTPRARPPAIHFRQGDPTRPKKLSRDMSTRLEHLNGPTAGDRAKRAEEKRARKALARIREVIGEPSP